MSSTVQSLYGRISLLYLALITAFALVCVLITFRCLILFWLEAEQRANLSLASNLAGMLAPSLQEPPETPPVGERMEQLSVINPTLELYLLDEEGRILAASVAAARLERDRVALGPIRALLRGDVRLPVHGDDPVDAEGEKVFSVAPVALPGGRSGFLYAILLGQPLEAAFGSIWDSYAIRIMALLLVSALAASGLFGTLLFRLVTRRLRRLTRAVEQLQAGDYGGRAGAGDASDEIGQLARAFDAMAKTIEAQMQELRQADQVRREFLADVSHDLRTPLTSTRAYAEQMLDRLGTLSREEQQTALKALLGNTVQLENLAAQLGEIARMDAGETTPHLEPFSIAELVHDVVVKFKPEAERRGLTLELAGVGEYPWVQGDIAMVERMLSNLVENALLNTPEGGAVRVALEEEPGHVRVRVADDGYGIPKEELPLVTRRFYRARRGSGSASVGTGLGLAIAREIAELHGSTLEIRSEVGRGTTVAFRLAITSPGAR